MKKILASTAVLVLLGVGGVFAYTQTEQPKKETVKEVNVQKESHIATVSEEKSEQEKPSTENVPTERTVDLGPDKPWVRMDALDIIGQQNSGEVVYLFSDAEELENTILSFSQDAFEELDDKSVNTFGNSKENMAVSWSKQIQAFIGGVSKDYDNPAYFNQMYQIQLALEAKDYEAIPALISEAKKLR